MKQIFEKWQEHAKLQLATLIVLVASFSVITGVMTISHNLSNILTLWGESLQMSVYLNETVTPEGVGAVERFLADNKSVNNVKFINKDQAMSQFREQMASYAPDLLNDNDLLRFIPSSFQFSLSKNVPASEHLATMQSLATSLKTQVGVDEVSYGQDWIKSYSSLTRGLHWAGIIFTAIIFVSAGFVMSNSINASVQQRRTEIEVLELIGATSRQIRRPFVVEGAVLAFGSSAIALILSYGLFLATKNSLHEQIAFLQLTDHLEFISATKSISILLFSVLLGAGSSWLCVRRINTGWAASEKSKESGARS